MTRPRLLDLFCGAGGAARGYQRAGFYVIGVDIEPQPRYCGDEFIQADALEVPLESAAAVHASPPCQHYSSLAGMHPGRSWPDLIGPTRERLLSAGIPFVIENVSGAPLARHPGLFGLHGIQLCGTAFGLGARGMELRRHRLFESNLVLPAPHCRHRLRTIGVYGHGAHSGKERMANAAEARQALDINWMNRDEMAEAIPPAYTEYIGGELLRELATAASRP